MKVNILFVILLMSFQTSSYKIAVLKYQGGGDWYANPTSLPNLVDFCNNNECKPSYSRLVTAGNNPSQSTRMQYSQFVKTGRYKTVRPTPQAPNNVWTPETEQYKFANNQLFIFNMSSIWK